MRVHRISVIIPTNQNTHRKYLYNEMLDLMNTGKFGGEFRNEHIKLSSMPDKFLKVLKKLKINYEIGK